MSLKTIPVDNSICGGRVLRLMLQKKKSVFVSMKFIFLFQARYYCFKIC